MSNERLEQFFEKAAMEIVYCNCAEEGVWPRCDHISLAKRMNDVLGQHVRLDALLKEGVGAGPEGPAWETRGSFVLKDLGPRALRSALYAGMASPHWNALEKQLAELLEAALAAQKGNASE